jgi:phosphatidylserine/phosphatidylglycerophosphate/cardiolipin synthase-like enzyme
MSFFRTTFLLLLFLFPLSGQGEEAIAPSLAKPKVYFSPQDDVASHLISMIDHEKKRVLVAVYCLTHRGVADALVRAHRRDVEVDVIVDPFSLKSRLALAKLNQGKVSLSVFDPDLVSKDAARESRRSQRRSLMHNKFCIFGDTTLWTGSFNFTYDANRCHQENVLVLEDKELVAQYEAKFQSIKKKCCRPYSDVVLRQPKKTPTILDTIKRNKS